MNTGVLTPGQSTPPSVDSPRTHSHEGWTVHEYATVPSTNLVAAQLPPWHAVRADTQTAGRGRFQRAWVSDHGGLWFSVTLPCAPDKPAPRCLPLTVGLAVCVALRELTVPDLRMRWPNDLLVGELKLAGVLLDQFNPKIAVAGIGLNVHNHPESADTKLKHKTARLADLLPSCPALPDLMHRLLHHLREVHEQFINSGFAALLPGVNQLWGPPRPVKLDLDGKLSHGIFTQVDHNGSLLLTGSDGISCAYEPNAVRHLTET